jgi:nitroreductase
VQPQFGGAQLLGYTFVFRGLLSPFAHPVFTAMTGIGVAYAATHRRAGWAAVAGLLGAMTLHGLWNGLSSRGGTGVGAAYVLVMGVLIALVAVVVADRRRTVRLIWRFLPAYEPTQVVTDADLRMLSRLRGRRRARLWALRTGGRPAARAMTNFQLAATELALMHQRAERGLIDPAPFEERRRNLLTLMAAARTAVTGRGPEGSQPGPGRSQPGPGPSRPGYSGSGYRRPPP